MIVNNNKKQDLNHLLVAPEKLTVTQPPENQQNLKDLDQANQNYLSNNNDLLPFLQKEAQQREKVYAKRESHIKFSSQLLRSCETSKGDTIFVHKARGSKQNLKIQNENNEEESRILCKHSVGINQKHCDICNDAGLLQQDNNLVKFFKYLIDFKMGKKSSYVRKTVNFYKNTVNSFCKNFYNQSQMIPRKSSNKQFTFRVNQRKSQKPTRNNRNSLISNEKTMVNDVEHIDFNQADRHSVRSTTIRSKEVIIEEMSQTIMIHEGYQCDNCLCEPIIGTRYRCNTCENYDQCQKCYNQLSHLHHMERIGKTGKTIQLENMLRFLAQPIKLGSSLSPASVRIRSGFISMAKSAMA